MNGRKCFVLGLLASFVLAPNCWAQVPPAPAIPATPIVPAAQPNLWSFLLPNAAQKAACKDCFCKSPLGQMTSSAAAPMSAMSGGLMTNRCAQAAIDNIINDPNKPSTSSEGAAARIKKDEADAKARREAVRFLGTVNCNYWPEATEALVLSLRKDPNECVRFEAALALRNGCCCNEKTIKAMEICVTGSDKDGAPPERSDRVRAAATDALARCPLLQIETDKKKDGDIQKTEAVASAVAGTRGGLANAHQANMASAPGTASAAATVHQRSGSLAGIFANAFVPSSTATSSPGPVMSQTKPVSLYELVTMRNTKQDYVAPIRVENTAPTPVKLLPAQMPRDARQISQHVLGTPMPVEVTTFERPRDSIGTVTVEMTPTELPVSRPTRP